MNRRRHFRSSQGPRLYEQWICVDGKRDPLTPVGKVDCKCPQNTAIENNLSRSSFCHFGLHESINQRTAMYPTKNSKVTNELTFRGGTGR
jgi:hypothetical protein